MKKSFKNYFEYVEKTKQEVLIPQSFSEWVATIELDEEVDRLDREYDDYVQYCIKNNYDF